MTHKKKKNKSVIHEQNDIDLLREYFDDAFLKAALPYVGMWIVLEDVTQNMHD